MRDKIINGIRVFLIVLGGFIGFKVGEMAGENEIKEHTVETMSEEDQASIKNGATGLGVVLGAGAGYLASAATPLTSDEKRKAKQDMYGYRWGEEI